MRSASVVGASALLSGVARAGVAADEGARAVTLMFDTHPTVFAVLGALIVFGVAVYGTKRVVAILGGR